MTRVKTMATLAGVLILTAVFTFGVRKVTAYQIEQARPKIDINKLTAATKTLPAFSYAVRYYSMNDKGVLVPVMLESHSQRNGRYADRIVGYNLDGTVNTDTRTGYDGENVFRVSDLKKLRSVYKDDGTGYSKFIINNTVSASDCSTRVFDGHIAKGVTFLGTEKLKDLDVVKTDIEGETPFGPNHLYVWAAPALGCAAVKKERWDAGKLVSTMELVSWSAQDDAAMYLINPEYPNVAPSDQMGAKTRYWKPKPEEIAALKKRMASTDKVWAHHRIQ